MRAFARVEADGKLSIPNNIRRQVRLKAGQLMELKVVGASKKRASALRAGKRPLIGRER